MAYIRDAANNLIGGSVGDVNDTIKSENGNDTLYGYGGNDFLWYLSTTNQNVYIDGGDGNDELRSDGGRDTLIGGSGDDYIIDFGGVDTIPNGNNFIDAGDGKDTINSESGNDTIYGGNGNDSINGNDGNDYINGGSGNDTIISGKGHDTLTGGSGVDLYIFEQHNGNIENKVITDFDINSDIIRINNSVVSFNDLVVQNNTDGNAVIYLPYRTITLNNIDESELSSANILVNISTSSKTVRRYDTDNDDYIDLCGTFTNDYFSISNAKGGNDTIYSYFGKDYLSGGDGDDYLSGGYHDDTLTGNDGNDTLEGGEGNDRFYFNRHYSGNHDVIVDFEIGKDEISLGYYVDEFASLNIVNNSDGNAVIYLYNGDTITINNVDSSSLSESDIKVWGTSTFIQGTNGDDIFGGDLFVDKDDIISGNRGNDTLYGYSGNDELLGSLGNDYVDGGTGADVITGGNGNDIVYGGDGNDYILANEAHSYASLNTYVDNDIIRGGEGNDTIFGNGLSDVSGATSDSDIFVYGNGDNGHDIIKDFGIGDDLIQIQNIYGISLYSDLLITNDVNGYIKIDIGIGTITLENISSSQIDSDDFIIV